MAGNEMILIASVAADIIQNKEVNAVLDKIRAEIEAEITPNLSDEQTQAFAYVLQIIDKYR